MTQDHQHPDQSTLHPEAEDAASEAPAEPAAAASRADDPAEDLSDLKAQIENHLAEIAELKDQVLRFRAETENVRRRSETEISKARQFSIKSFAERLVPVKDSLEAALAQKDQSVEALTQGVETTLKQLTSAFEQNNLTEIAPQAGDKFDPNLHQAVASVPHPEVAANCIVSTMQKGYALGERVIRAAMVEVSAGN